MSYGIFNGKTTVEVFEILNYLGSIEVLQFFIDLSLRDKISQLQPEKIREFWIARERLNNRKLLDEIKDGFALNELNKKDEKPLNYYEYVVLKSIKEKKYLAILPVLESLGFEKFCCKSA